MKMYILIKDDLPLGFAMVATAHASLACYLEFKDSPEMVNWLEKSFRKVVCMVTNEEFEMAKEFSNHVVITESTLGDKEVAIVFCPRVEWPKVFKSYRLYKLWCGGVIDGAVDQ